MNICVTNNQLTAIIGTMIWATEQIESDSVQQGLEPKLKQFAVRQAEYNRRVIQDLEDQR